MLDLLRKAGFSPKRLARNFGHNQQRMAFEAIKPALIEGFPPRANLG